MLLYASPFFIVRDLAASVRHYCDVLGFRCELLAPEEAPFFAVVTRDRVSVTLKEIGAETPPLPNRARHEDARWDVFVGVSDADALDAELVGRGANVRVTIRDDDAYGTRGFELEDADGYVLAFGA